jgi:hypothetical protein
MARGKMPFPPARINGCDDRVSGSAPGLPSRHTEQATIRAGRSMPEARRRLGVDIMFVVIWSGMVRRRP